MLESVASVEIVYATVDVSEVVESYYRVHESESVVATTQL